MNVKKLDGNSFFRQRIIMSILSATPIEISSISLTQVHSSLFRLLDKITKGSVLKVNLEENCLYYKPGSIVGGKYVTHECCKERGIGYYVEVLMVICMFGKMESNIVLRGITNMKNDISVDMLQRNTAQISGKYFGLDGGGQKIEIKHRGGYPEGGGEIRFYSPIFKSRINNIKIDKQGLVKRIRGVCYSLNISSSISSRIVHTSKGILLKYLPDVFITTDHRDVKFKSRGYAIYLEALMNNGQMLSIDYTGSKNQIAEEFGKHSAHMLCEEIQYGGCFDRSNQWFVLLLMSLSIDKVSRVRFGSKLNPYAVEMLRNIKEFLGIQFNITTPNNNSILCTCVGSNYKNLNWKSS